MLKVKKHGVILEPANKEFESQGVMNPACIKEGNSVHMFYRAVRWGNNSTIGYARLEGPLEVVERSKKPFMSPRFKYEKQGLEDPRIVKIDDTYYMTYVAYDGKDVLTAYAVSKDLKKFKRMGVITPRITYSEAEKWLRYSKLKDSYFFFESYYKDTVAENVLLREKDTFFFPKKIKGKFALIHRIIPDIQVIYFRDFRELTPEFWKRYLKHLSRYVVLEQMYSYESRNIGGGCPPIETDKGWVLIYHAVEGSNMGKIYHAGAALLDKKDPCKVIGHLKKPLFSPEERWERVGVSNNVVFPTGSAVFDEKLYIYYGAADKRIAVASVNLDDLIEEMLKNGSRRNSIE